MKVLIVDDHPIVISGLKALLEQERGIEVVAAMSIDAAEAAFAAGDVNVAVVDINLPELSGFELARRLLAKSPAAQILIFSMNDDPVFVAEAIEAGAKGYVSKNDNPALMLKAIRTVSEGGTAWPPGISAKLAAIAEAEGAAQAGLSARDKEILRLLAKGKSLYEIADLVSVSYKTVATSCAALRTRLGARTQGELVRIAVERKLV